MVAGSRFTLQGGNTNFLYVTLTGASSASGVFTFTFSTSSTSRHFVNGSISVGSTATFRFKPATTDIITGQDITPNSISAGQILDSVITPAKINDGGQTPVAGQSLTVNADGTAFSWEEGVGVSYDTVTAAIGAVDSWFGRDTAYVLMQDTDSELVAGSMRLYGTGANPDPSLSAPLVFRIEVIPHTGRHANVMSGMVLGSVLRVTQGNAETVFAASAAPTVDTETTPPTYTFQAATATHYVGTGTFDGDTSVTFEFRPAPENPVVPADFIPGL